jgi:hypothetical protein
MGGQTQGTKGAWRLLEDTKENPEASSTALAT